MKRRDQGAMRRTQRGSTAVEFAIAGGVSLLLLLGVIEVGRMFYVLNTLGESTRRAARLAAVCPVNDPAIARAALLLEPGQGRDSRLLSGLEQQHVQLTYLDAAGATTAAFANIRYVRVAIVGFTHTMLVPFIGSAVTLPSFTTTLPTESLGWVPELNARVCMGA